MTTKFVLAGCLALLSIAFACPAPAADAKVEQALRDLDAQWSAAAAAKDLDKTVSYYADAAVVMPPNAPSVTTKDAIRSAWKEMIVPGTAISWKASKVEVGNDADLAYVSGTYEYTMNDASGKPVKDHGKYIEIFKKQVDATWKVVADIWNSDLPAAPLEKK